MLTKQDMFALEAIYLRMRKQRTHCTCVREKSYGDTCYKSERSKRKGNPEEKKLGPAGDIGGHRRQSIRYEVSLRSSKLTRNRIWIVHVQSQANVQRIRLFSKVSIHDCHDRFP